MADVIHQNKNLKRLIRNCIIFSFIAHALCAWVVNGMYHPDELFQILEFGGYKLGAISADHLQWEFAAHIRPALQPAMVVLVSKLTGVSFNPVHTALALRIISSIIGWLSLTFITLIGLNWLKDDHSKRFLLYSYAFLWFLPVIQAHFSSESLSGSLFFAGLGCVWMARNKPTNYWLMAGGFLVGLAYICRYQSALLIVGLFAWCIFIGRFGFKKLAWFLIPAALAVLAGILIDRWFYGEWVNTAWNYFKVNIIQGKANEYGRAPVWSYFVWNFNELIPPLSIIIIAGALFALIRFPKNSIVMSIIPFIVLHFLISHKEPRFLYPLIIAVPVLLALSYSKMQSVFHNKGKFRAWFNKLFFGLNILCLLVLLIKPRLEPFTLFDAIHENYARKPSIMLCDRDEPYSFNGMVTWFYQPKARTYFTFLNKKKMDSIISNARMHPVLVLFNREQPASEFYNRHPDAKLIYTNIPAWMYWFNINNWIGRTGKYTLYEMPG